MFTNEKKYVNIDTNTNLNGEIFMKKLISVFCAVILLASTFSLAAYAVITPEDANAAVSAKNKTFNEILDKKFDASGNGKLDAADARAILLCSAGLSNGANLSNADTDGDGVITAIDARYVLRLSAGLESADPYYSANEKLDYFNAIINSVKPNQYRYYKMEISSVDAATYKDPKGIIASMNKQLKRFEKYMDEPIDMGAELTKTEKSYSYFNLASTTNKISNSVYPVSGYEAASMLTADNVAKIEFKKNQTFNYVHYNTKGAQTYTEAIGGLDSITVYIKDDGKITNIPEDTTVFHSGKAFNVLQQQDIKSIINSSAFGDLGGIEEFGTFEVTPTFNHINYYNSFITIYFKHDSGTIVGSVHNLHYDISINLDFNIFLSWGGIITGTDSPVGKILEADGDIDIINTMTDSDTFYFYTNNENHVAPNL